MCICPFHKNFDKLGSWYFQHDKGPAYQRNCTSECVGHLNREGLEMHCMKIGDWKHYMLYQYLERLFPVAPKKITKKIISDSKDGRSKNKK